MRLWWQPLERWDIEERYDDPSWDRECPCKGCTGKVWFVSIDEASACEECGHLAMETIVDDQYVVISVQEESHD